MAPLVELPAVLLVVLPAARVALAVVLVAPAAALAAA
jgi:hypothetical protein